VAPRSLVTGANGFLGSHLVEGLLAAGGSVRCLVRPTSDIRWIPREGVDLVHGDVTDPAGLPAALAGCEVVFHLAGLTRADSEADYDRVNVHGTRNLAEAARTAGDVRRLVLISSLAAGGPSERGRPRRALDPDAPINAYGRSKLRGEHALRESAGDLEWSILRPAAVYGPRDRAFLMLARMVRRGWTFQVSGARQEVSVIHARDVVQGALRAASPEAPGGQVHYLAHPVVTDWVEIGETMARVLGRSVRTLTVPRRLIPVVGGLSGRWAAVSRTGNRLPSDRIRDLLTEAWTTDPRETVDDLGFAPEIDLEAGLQETLTWYAEEDWL
jgi:nucleoside-diphosphate-sugar epimerase